MPRRSRSADAQALEQRRSESAGGAGGARIDMRLDVELADGQVFSFGGVWSKRTEEFEGEAETGHTVYPHPGQTRALLWFRDWLFEHAHRRVNPPPFDPEATEVDTDPLHVYSALFAGGRRGGKTWEAMLFGVIYGILFPGAIVWIVSPSHKKHDEARRYLTDFIAHEWTDRETLEGWELVNGSAIMLKTAWTAEGLKEGKVNFCVLNEGQMMDERVYTLARGGVSDKSGLVLVCANPPVEDDDRVWVSDFAADAQSGKRASLYLEFSPLDNPHIDRTALLAMRHELDHRTFQIEVLGRFLGPRNAVAYNWDRLESEAPAPFFGDWEDVTAEFMSSIEEGDGITQVVGLDVQRYPHIGGPVYRFYIPYGEREVTRETVVAWIIDEIVLEGGDEIDWALELAARKTDDDAQLYAPDQTLIICDASGRYQHSRRRHADDPPPKWTGKGSFDLIRGEGYWRIVPPDRRMDKNPEIVDRVRAFTSMICNAARHRRLFADPARAPKTTKSIREWMTKNGKVDRREWPAHLGDAASYPMVRLFPRVLRSDKPGGVDPIAARVDKAPPPGTITIPGTAPSAGRRRPSRSRSW